MAYLTGVKISSAATQAPGTPRAALSFWQIWNLSFGFFGIQFGWGLQMGNMSAIYEYLGAKPAEIPLLWLAAPLTGMLVQPVIGSMSDHTWGRFGRRRPYFFAGAVLSSLALLIMPQAGALWMAAGLLWILDTSINVSMEPFRAFVADLLPVSQRTRGFAMQSFFIGLGAVFASVLPYLLHTVWKVDGDYRGRGIPRSVRIAFYVGAVIFFCAVLYTVLKTREHPPEDLEAFSRRKRGPARPQAHVGAILSAVRHMPRVMRQLSAVQFFTWMGLFFMWIYFTVAIPKTCFGNPPVGSAEYIRATGWGSLCFGFYSLVTFAVALVLPRIARLLGRKQTHAACLLAGGAGLLSVWFIRDPYWLLASMTGVGVAWASVLSMPYAILSTHIPGEKMGLYMGIFNFFIVLPEVLSTLCFGFVVSHFLHDDKILAVALGGLILFVAAFLMLRVADGDVEPGEVPSGNILASGLVEG